MDASRLSKNASRMPDEHVASQDKPLPRGGLRICKEAAYARPLVRICENTHIHTHRLSFSKRRLPTQIPSVSACISGFSNAVGLNLHAQISDHQLMLATTSKAIVNGSFSLGMILCLFFIVVVVACLAPLHRSHVQYSLSGGASGMP